MIAARITGDPRFLWLFEVALEKIQFAAKHGLSSAPLQLVLAWRPSAERARLLKRRGPWGQVHYLGDGKSIAIFDANEVATYLVKSGAIYEIEPLENDNG